MRPEPDDLHALRHRARQCGRPADSADSVEPYNRYTGEGTGFGFLNFNAHELLFTTQEACRLYTESPVAWGDLAAQGMAKDFSWRASALEYRKLYRGLFT